MNLRLPPIHPAIAQPLKPVQYPRSALNRDPIDSFERAVGGDEFDNLKPVEPIRVIKVESAEVLEPMRPTNDRRNRMDQRKRKILQSITRHMNEIHHPRVIPFADRHDETVSDRMLPTLSEVKISRIQPSKIAKEASSLEIADEIIDNIIGETSIIGSSSSDLLQDLNVTESTSNQTTNSNATSSEIVSGFGEAAQLLSMTSSPLTELSNIDRTLEAISSEIPDYDSDEFALFSNTDQGSSNTTEQQPETSFQPTTTSSTTSVIPETKSPPMTTTVAAPEEEEEDITTITQKSTTTTTAADDSDQILASLQEEETQERTTITAATAAATTTTTTTTTTTAASTTTLENVEDDFRAVLKEQQKEILRARKEGQKRDKTTEETEKSEEKKEESASLEEKKEENEISEEKKEKEETAEKKKSTLKHSHKITELNSETIKSIERDMKKKNRKMKKTKGKGEDKAEQVEEDKAEEVEEEEEVAVEEVAETTIAPTESPSEDVTTTEAVSKKKVVGKKEKMRRKKIKKTLKSNTAEGDLNKSINEALEQNLRQTIASISKTGERRKSEENERTDEPDETEVTEKVPEKESNTVDEEETEDEITEKPPTGAGGQVKGEFQEVTTVEQVQDYSSESAVTPKVVKLIKNKKWGKMKRKLKKGQRTKKVKEDDSKGEMKDAETTTIEPENIDDDVEEKPKKKKPVKKLRKKGKSKETEDIMEEETDAPETTTTPIKIGAVDVDIRTENLKASLKDAPNAKYYYPPKVMVPLPSCFYNPSGYVCCNLQLNNLIEDTFEMIKTKQSHSDCNIARMANIIQQKSEEMFGHPFESVVALSDFAQNVHFAGDLVCKVEIDGKYMLTYATPYDAEHAVESVDVIEDVPLEESALSRKSEEDGDEKTTKKPKKSLKPKKKALPIHNFRM
nr:Ground region domain containing protein [Haemonchus contortus]